MGKIITTTLLILLLALAATATEVPTMELGRKLFHAKNLGTSGNSCATCHPGGKGLDEIEAYDDGMLKEMINFCIRDALKGEMIDLESTEMESFRLYVRSLDN